MSRANITEISADIHVMQMAELPSNIPIHMKVMYALQDFSVAAPPESVKFDRFYVQNLKLLW